MSEQYELNRFCPDSDCAGIAEPEEDFGEGGKILRYWVCRTCETEFGHQLIDAPGLPGDVCQIGIPARVRQLMDQPFRGVPGRTFLGTTIGRRPE